MDIDQSKTEREAAPKMFQIGFDFCAARYINRLFKRNGYQAMYWANGNIAFDIHFAKLAGSVPLQASPDVTCYSALQSVHLANRRPIEAFREFKFLQDCFPDAVFVYDTRNIDDWIRIKLSEREGKHAKVCAYVLDVGLPELVDIWRRGWAKHNSAVLNHFKDYEKFFHFDCDQKNIDALSRFLGKWYSVPKKPNKKLLNYSKVAEDYIDTAAAIFDKKTRRVSKDNRIFADRVAQHCLGKILHNNPAGQPRSFSHIYAKWDGKDEILDKRGNALPVLPDRDGIFHSQSEFVNLHRVAQTINEFRRIGKTEPVLLDMQDARGYGIDGISDIENPVVVYNRRPGTTNLVLWPLPGYHSLGLDQFVHDKPIDSLSYKQKIDVAGWRGSLTGKANVALAPNLRRYRSSGRIVRAAIGAKTEDETELVLTELMALTRYNLVARGLFSDNIDAAITYDKLSRPAENSPLFKYFFDNRVPHRWFYNHKFILSLSGYDTGSNFFLGANSNSVVMKEEDGWELFYTAEFKAWEHYIPLNIGALDVEEKIDWAKSNPKKCIEISKAASNLCAKFANPKTRQLTLAAVFDGMTRGRAAK